MPDALPRQPERRSDFCPLLTQRPVCRAISALARLVISVAVTYDFIEGVTSMREIAVIAVVVQLLLRGVAVPHNHAQSHDEPADHAQRPHVHLVGESHAANHRHAKHQHSHRHDGDQKQPDTPGTSRPAEPSPLSPDHDQDAIYVGGENLTRSADRSQAPQPTETGEMLSRIESGNIADLPKFVAARAIGPPGKCADTHLDLLPHLLRI